VLLVPEPARPLLQAARTFLTLRGTPPNKRLLAVGIGGDAQHLAASALACGLSLPVPAPRVGESWQLRASAWWVGTHLHHPGETTR
jgi:hypothetical protein